MRHTSTTILFFVPLLNFVQKDKYLWLKDLNGRNSPDAGTLLPHFQIIDRFDFSTFLVKTMNLNIYYILMQSKHYKSRKDEITCILKRTDAS